jgi:hypothetical protein
MAFVQESQHAHPGHALSLSKRAHARRTRFGTWARISCLLERERRRSPGLQILDVLGEVQLLEQ